MNEIAIQSKRVLWIYAALCTLTISQCHTFTSITSNYRISVVFLSRKYLMLYFNTFYAPMLHHMFAITLDSTSTWYSLSPFRLNLIIPQINVFLSFTNYLSALSICIISIQSMLDYYSLGSDIQISRRLHAPLHHSSTALFIMSD